MENNVTAKFGGSSLADASQFKKVIDIVRSDPRRKHVVVSAPGKANANDDKVTDLLYALHAGGKPGMGDASICATLIERFDRIACGIGIHFRPSTLWRDVFAKLNYFRELPPDLLVSYGEHVTAKIMAEALGYNFVEAASVVKFNAKGDLDMTATSANADWLLTEANGYVMPGFYGAMPDGSVKTFSRGGGDLSGAIVAALTKAERYENWTDVSGILMADPRIVHDARKIDVITYTELRELSYMGASVLHDEVIFPLRKAGIPIQLRNTNDVSDMGTLVVPDAQAPSRDEGSIVGIAGRKDFTVITIEKTLMNKEVGFIRKVCTVFERHGVSLEHIPGGIDSICVVVSTESLKEHLGGIVADIMGECNTDSVRVAPDIALVCTVGNSMVQARGVAGRLFTALAVAGINVRMIDQGTSERSIIVGVENADYEKTVRTIYRAFPA